MKSIKINRLGENIMIRKSNSSYTSLHIALNLVVMFRILWIMSVIFWLLFTIAGNDIGMWISLGFMWAFVFLMRIKWKINDNQCNI